MPVPALIIWMSGLIMVLSLRMAEASDAPAITALIESAYRGEGSRRGWTTEEHLIEGNRTSVAEITENISAPNKRFILAFDHGALVGCAMIKDDGGKGYFGMFAVRPDHHARRHIDQAGDRGVGSKAFALGHLARKLGKVHPAQLRRGFFGLAEGKCGFAQGHGPADRIDQLRGRPCDGRVGA